MKSPYVSVLFLFFALTLFFAQPAIYATENKTGVNKVGEIKYLKGKAIISRAGKKLDASKEDSILLLDTANTEKASRLNIVLIEDSLLILDADSILSVDEFSHGDKKGRGESMLFLSKGRVRAKTCNNRLKIHTPTSMVTAPYRTTDFVVWESPVEGKRAFCLAVLKDPSEKIAIVDFKSKDKNITVRVPEGYKVCDGETEPVPIPEELLDEFRELQGDIDWKCKEKCVEGEVFRKGECVDKCNECERLNPQGKCIPDNCKPCDDKNPCTVEDHCLGRKCKGKKDPSPTDPACLDIKE